MRSPLRFALFVLAFALVTGVASVAVAAPVLPPGVGWTDSAGVHSSLPAKVCTSSGCQTFQVWPAPAIAQGATATHGPRGTVCTNCHTVTSPPVLGPGVGWTDSKGKHAALPALCTGCHTFQVWPAPAIAQNAAPDHGPRGTTCTQCHAILPPPPADIASPTVIAMPLTTTEITLGWPASDGAVGYRVFRAASAAGPFSQIASVTAPSYFDTARAAGTRYYYQVKGVDANGALGPASGTVSARTYLGAATVRVDSSLGQLTVTGTGWKTLKSSVYYGGSTRSNTIAARKITVPFRGTGITWYGSRGKSFGKASMYVDGKLVKTVDLYSATAQYNKALVAKTGLSDAAHTLTITIASAKNAKSTGRRVDIDSFGITGTVPGLNQEESRGVFAGTWSPMTGTGFSASAARGCADATGSVTYKFSGTGVTWLGSKGANYGQAQIFVDGVLAGVVDQWGGHTAYRRPIWSVTGLAKVAHTVKIVPIGTHNAIATASAVDVDAFVTR